MELSRVSAFKLFYDEFIYKENNGISYALIGRNIENIRELTIDLRKTSKHDVDLYKVKLERTNQRIREQLNEILNINKNVYEYFYLMYKARVEVCNDKIEDMPFVISNAFYEDYRLDNKSPLELENSPYVIPKYTSLEKKEIRSGTKGLTRLEYLYKLLNESENKNLYKRFLEKTRSLLSIKPNIKETHKVFFERVYENLNGYEEEFNRLVEKVKNNSDYERISDLMEIAFRKKFIEWNKEYKKIVDEHFDKSYEKMKNNDEVISYFNLANDISFESFKEITEDLVLEKQQYMRDFENSKFEFVSTSDNSYVSKFKENLINSFFDKRYTNSLVKNTVDEYINRAIDLYRLADDLGNQIFERVMYNASHSDSLKRNNDVRSAIINKIYDLYNPVYLLAIYEKAKNTFLSLLKNNNEEFIKEYNVKLNEEKVKNGYHGPIPTMQIIKMRVIDRQKQFILENCITELKSIEKSSYDTRNYDLEVVAKDIEINDMINLYEDMKVKINTFDYDTSNSLMLHGKKETLVAAQKFVVKDIYNKLKFNDTDTLERENRYRDICYGYLNEECIFLNSKKNNIIGTNLDKFMVEKNKFNKKSKWSKFVDDNKLKANI